MKTFFCFLLMHLLTFSLYAKKEKAPSFIHVIPGGGRMGDQLIHYIKAKWISYKNDIPLILIPNKHYNHFDLSRWETFCRSSPRSRHRIPINKTDVFLDKDQGGYYLINYFPLPSYEMLTLMKKDLIFMKEMKKLISPIKPIPLIPIPQNMTSVALHIRTESNSTKGLKSLQIYDIACIDTTPIYPGKGDCMDLDFPGKFTPLQFFVDQLKYLSAYFDHKPLYVFIFTDDLFPEKLASQIEKGTGLDNLVFDWRKENFHPDNAIIEDFFSIMQFDCLIRPQSSNFSLIADFLGNNAISIFPQSFHWEIDQNKNWYLITDKTTIEHKP